MPQDYHPFFILHFSKYAPIVFICNGRVYGKCSENAGQILGYCVWQIDNILDSRDSTHCNTPPLQTFELESKN